MSWPKNWRWVDELQRTNGDSTKDQKHQNSSLNHGFWVLHIQVYTSTSKFQILWIIAHPRKTRQVLDLVVSFHFFWGGRSFYFNQPLGLRSSANRPSFRRPTGWRSCPTGRLFGAGGWFLKQKTVVTAFCLKMLGLVLKKTLLPCSHWRICVDLSSHIQHFSSHGLKISLPNWKNLPLAGTASAKDLGSSWMAQPVPLAKYVSRLDYPTTSSLSFFWNDSQCRCSNAHQWLTKTTYPGFKFHKSKKKKHIKNNSHHNSQPWCFHVGPRCREVPVHLHGTELH